MENKKMLKMKFKMAIIGHGFVGKAVDYGFSHQNVEKTIIDPLYNTTVRDIPTDAKLVFVCVPTPFGNFQIFRDVMEDLRKNGFFGNSVVVIKSTVPPDVLKEFKASTVIYNPEFLTEKFASEDFINPSMHVFGGDPRQADLLETYYNEYSLCSPAPVFKVSIEEASIIKYTINSFLATKVMFFNQIYQLCQETGFDFNKITNAVGAEPRIGKSHTKVPGFDGKLGFGGACFPKDTKAFIDYSDKLSILKAVVDANNKIRAGYDLDDREKVQGVVYKSA